MIGRADIEGSKSNVAMNAWLPQASSFVPGDSGRDFPATSFYLHPLCFSRGVLPEVDKDTVSGGSSPYLKPVRCQTARQPTSYRALNR